MSVHLDTAVSIFKPIASVAGPILTVLALQNPQLITSITQPLSPRKINQTTEMVERAQNGSLNERTFERESEIDSLTSAIETGGIIILYGKSGVGKTALVEELAIRIAQGQVSSLANVKIHELRVKDAQGSPGLANFFAKVMNGGAEAFIGQLIEEVKPRKGEQKRVLFIDEIQELTRRHPDIFDDFKTELARGLVIVGGTTNKAVAPTIRAPEGMARRVTVIDVYETSPEITLKILKKRAEELKNLYDQKHSVQVTITDEAFQTILQLSHKALPQRVFPDRAVTCLKQICVCAVNKQRQSQKPQVTIDKSQVYDYITQRSGVNVSILKEIANAAHSEKQFKEKFSQLYFPPLPPTTSKSFHSFIQDQARRVQLFFKNPQSRYLAISGSSYLILNQVIDQFSILMQGDSEIVRCPLDDLLCQVNRGEIRDLLKNALSELFVGKKNLIIQFELKSDDFSTFFKKEDTTSVERTDFSRGGSFLGDRSIVNTFNQVGQNLGLGGNFLSTIANKPDLTMKEANGRSDKQQLIDYIFGLIKESSSNVRFVITQSSQPFSANHTISFNNAKVELWNIPSIQAAELINLLADKFARNLEAEAARKKQIEEMAQARLLNVRRYSLTLSRGGLADIGSLSSPSLNSLQVSAHQSKSGNHGAQSPRKGAVNTSWIREMVFVIHHLMQQLPSKNHEPLEDCCLAILDQVPLKEEGPSSEEMTQAIATGFNGRVSERDIQETAEKISNPNADIFKKIFVPEYLQDPVPMQLNHKISSQQLLGIAEPSEARKQYLKKQIAYSFSKEGNQVFDLDVSFLREEGFSEDLIGELFVCEFKTKKNQQFLIIADEETLKIPKIKDEIAKAKCKVICFCKAQVSSVASTSPSAKNNATSTALPIIGDLGNVKGIMKQGMSIINGLSTQLTSPSSSEPTQQQPAEIKIPESKPEPFVLPPFNREECEKILSLQLKIILDTTYNVFHTSATLDSQAQQALVKLYLAQIFSKDNPQPLDVISSSMVYFLKNLLEVKTSDNISSAPKKSIAMEELMAHFSKVEGQSMKMSLQDFKYIVDPQLTTQWYRTKRWLKNVARSLWSIITAPVFFVMNMVSKLFSFSGIGWLTGLATVYSTLSPLLRFIRK